MNYKFIKELNINNLIEEDCPIDLIKYIKNNPDANKPIHFDREDMMWFKNNNYVGQQTYHFIKSPSIDVLIDELCPTKLLKSIKSSFESCNKEFHSDASIYTSSVQKWFIDNNYLVED